MEKTESAYIVHLLRKHLNLLDGVALLLVRLIKVEVLDRRRNCLHEDINDAFASLMPRWMYAPDHLRIERVDK